MRFLFFLALIGITSSRVLSQQMSSIEGVVRDEAGGVALAQISAFDSLTNERRNVIANERGFFRIIDVTPGGYVVSATSLGHAPSAQLINVAVGQQAQIDFVLQQAPNVLETVKVVRHRDNASSIDRTSVSTALTPDEIRRLPLNTRNVMDLAAVAPGIRSFQPVEGHSLPAAGALRDERAINLYVDGVEMKNMNSTNVVGSPQSGSLIAVDGLQEYQVHLNPYDAEFTRGAAYIISAVTRRGTNEAHGSGFGFFQNKDLVSVTRFQRNIPNFEKPDFNRMQSGITLRGPLIRNRLFYAFSYEISDMNNYVAIVPGRPATNPAVWDQYAGVFNAPSRNQAGTLRATYAANEKNTLEMIWSSRYMSGESGFGGIDSKESAFTQANQISTINLRHRWLPKSGIANDLSLQLVSWATANRPIVDGATVNYPTLRIGRGNSKFEIREAQYRVVDRLTYSIGSGPGSHLLKTGVEVGPVTAEQFSPPNGQGVFRFSAEGDPNPASASISVGFFDPNSDRDARTSLSGWIAGSYINDEWRVTPRLLLNLGVRYDVELKTMDNDFTVPWVNDATINSRPELKGLLNRGDRKDDLNNVAPRVSFSWDVSGNRRTFLRGGFGIMYDRIPGFVPFAEKQSAAWRNYMFGNPGTTDPHELRNRVIAGGGTAVPPAITLLPHRMEVPENRQWSVGLGLQMSRSVALNMDFVDQHVRNLFAPLNLNSQDLSQTPTKRVMSSAYGNIVAWGNFARARYRALLTRISFNPDSTLQLNLSHTLASAKADWDVGTISVPMAVRNQFYQMQRTSGDERNRFVLSGVWTTHYGITLSTIATAASPRPYRTWVGQDLNKDGVLEDDWINGRRYNVPPNTWKYWYRVVDLRATKSISVRRDTQLAVIAEVFNLFNTENYAGYFGVQRSANGDPRPDFGSPSGTFATRQFQLGSKIEF